jgi:ankyrin repeat protein
VKGAEDMHGILVLLRRWQTYVAFMLMLIFSSVYLIAELQQEGIWIILIILAPAAIVLMWAITVPDNNETTWISGKAVALCFFVIVLIALPLPLNITAAVIAVRSSLEAGGISPFRILPLASGVLAMILLLSAWIPLRREEKLSEAIEGGKLEIVRSLVHNEKDANREFHRGSVYPLHMAVYNGRASIVAYLLEKGADVAQRNENDETALTALFNGNHALKVDMEPEYDEVAASLIDAGSPVTSEDMWAVYRIRTQAKTLAALSRRLFTPRNVHEKPPELGYYLKTAIQKKDNAIVEQFLAAGGDLDFRNAEGVPLLITAMEAENDDLAQYLMKRGADVTIRKTPSTISPKPGENTHKFRETDGRDYLGGLTESTVRMFFERASFLRLDKDFAYTPPLNDAAGKGNIKVMELLLEKGADIDDMYAAKTALHCAMSNKHTKAVRFLLDRGADINLGASPDETPLVSACESNPKMALILLDSRWGNRLRLNGRELAKASRFGHLELVKALVRHGADVNARDENGNTPWCNAVKWWHKDVARFLAAHGADTTSKYQH